MRNLSLVLLCALILAEGILLYGLYEQYEALAVEKNAVERRADVLKTLFDQTEKELTAEKEKWQAERLALLNVQNELKQELAEKNSGTSVASAIPPTDYPGLLQGLYTQLYVGAEGVLGNMSSIFQQGQLEEKATPAPPVSTVPTEEKDVFTDAILMPSTSPVLLQKTWD